MNDEANIESPTEIREDGISRRQLLGMGALGLAGTLLAPPAPRPAFADDGPPGHGGRPSRLLLRGGIVLTLDKSTGDFDQADVLIENGKNAGNGACQRSRSGRCDLPGFFGPFIT